MVTYFLYAIVVAGIISLSFCVVLAVRNHSVSIERKRIIRHVYDANMKDLSKGLYSTWRWDVYERGPSYDQMWLQFWKPVGSFFPPVSEWKKPVEPSKSRDAA